MTTTLSDIRFLLEKEVRGADLDNQDIINWCNQANMEIGMNIDIPSTPQTIVLDTATLSYSLNANLKIINRLRIQSDITAGIDRALLIKYRVYNGQIIIPNVFWVAPDSLVVDYYKHMTYFTDISNTIDIDDRFEPFYTLFCKLKYHNTQPDSGKVFWRVTIAENSTMITNYQNMKNQVISYYSLSNDPVVVDNRWRG